MKILVLTQQYPKNDDLYRNNFVHTRIKSYQELNSNISCTIFVPSKQDNHYLFEGINVIEGNTNKLVKILESDDYEKIIVHFLTYKMVDPLLSYAQHVPKYIWVHGYEALGWRRRLFNAVSPRFVAYIIKNLKQLRSFKKYIKKEQNSHFIFVSNWMKLTAEKDLNSNFTNYSIIPNGIDTEMFLERRDRSEIRKNVLLIRSFNSRKYATDIAIKGIVEFSKYDEFKNFNFTIVGEGKYFKRDIEKIVNFHNVSILNKFLNAKEIKELHDRNGIFLCPTRQDAQGVSMCEAMGSGLVPITTNNTAIPEFVKDNHDGILTSNPKEIAEALNELGVDEQYYNKLSKNASNKIIEELSLKDIIDKELALVLN